MKIEKVTAMRTIDIDQATKELSALLDALENGSEGDIVITREGKPVARLLAAPAETKPGKRILGILEGKVKLPEGWEEDFKAQRKESEDLIYESALEEEGDQTYVLDPAKIRSIE